MVKYLSFSVSVENLESLLNKYGKDGWRLFTCQVTPTHGAIGSGIPNATVVMEKLENTVEEDTAEEPKSEAMPMKG